MSMLQILAKKRDGRALSAQDIEYMIEGAVAGSIPDYQMAAFLMAAYIRGMNADETYSLTKAMAESGEIMDLSGIEGVTIDKHSTGGVGDKVSIILGPMLASAGAKVAKMSGRALGYTGGTIDKLESIPGFSADLSKEQFIKQVNEIGIALICQTEEICPADKILYALRDMTATVPSIPLIASSVMSKKIAGGADAIVIDVKVGSGAFMKTVDEAKELANELISIGRRFGKRITAVITNMDQPLGLAIGNSLEVEEAIDTLKGFGSADVLEICFTLGSQAMVTAGLAPTKKEAIERLNFALESGHALNKFREFIEAQGGDGAVIDNPRTSLPHAKFVEDISIAEGGFVKHINAEELGVAVRILGAGRKAKDDPIDHGAGIIITHKVGDYIDAGKTIAQMHSNDAHSLAAVAGLVYDAFELSVHPHDAPPSVYDIIE